MPGKKDNLGFAPHMSESMGRLHLVDLWHHQIEDQNRRGKILIDPCELVGTIGYADLERRTFGEHTHNLADGWFVVDDQKTLFCYACATFVLNWALNAHALNDRPPTSDGAISRKSARLSTFRASAKLRHITIFVGSMLLH